MFISNPKMSTANLFSTTIWFGVPWTRKKIRGQTTRNEICWKFNEQYLLETRGVFKWISIMCADPRIKNSNCKKMGVAIDIVLIILAFILPPLPVFLKVQFHGAFWLNILLTLLGWIPGIVHAIYIVASRRGPRYARGTVATAPMSTGTAVRTGL